MLGFNPKKEDLQRRGFQVIDGSRPAIPSTLEASLGFLSNVESIGYCFAPNADAVVPAINENSAIFIFGHFWSGLFYLSDSGVFYSDDVECTQCNSSIEGFTKTVSCMLSIIFDLRANFDASNLFQIAESKSKEMLIFFSDVECDLKIEDTFWGEFQYELEDGMFSLYNNPNYYRNIGVLPPKLS